MKCPHCGTVAVFEALKAVTFRPVIEAWRTDNPINQMTSVECCCLTCDRLVIVDVRNQYIKPLERPVVWDDEVERVMTWTSENPEQRAGQDLVERLRAKNFRHIDTTMTGRQLRGSLVEQRP